MQIEFASSGGFANLSLDYRVDTDTLPEEQAKEVVRLVESSGISILNKMIYPPTPKLLLAQRM